MAEPAISVRAASDSGSPNTPIHRIVIHATAGGRGYPNESGPGVAEATAAYFHNPGCPGSAHYVEDLDSEQHCLPDDVIGWHAPPNKGSIGIEICADANYSPEEWLSPQVWPAVQRAAARARELCQRFGVPMVKLSPADLLAGKQGVCGHIDVSQAWHQSSHWDPGPGFPWPQFMAEVNQGGPVPPPAPPAPAPAPLPRPLIFQWDLPLGSYYGNIAGPAQSHGGYYPAERDHVRNIQQWLVRGGFAKGQAPASWPSTGWADGKWEAQTDAAMVAFHAARYPNQPKPAQCWADDYAHLVAQP